MTALVAVARSILGRLAPTRRPTARFRDLGPNHYASRISTERHVHKQIRQLAALCYTVTLEPAA